MHLPCPFRITWFAVGCLLLLQAASSADAAEPLKFNRDIRPILSEHCFQCHGPDNNTREAGLRLDDREQAIQPAESDEIAIVPGKPGSSELVRRIFSEDEDLVMPPPDFNKTLTAAQKQMLKQWVAEGAGYERHWAFTPPLRAEPPVVKRTDWPRNPIDHFILARLKKEGLTPSPEAERATLFRRLSLDLTGLPPSPADVAAFGREMTAAKTGDVAERVYEKWVNKLLDSPHYGERMAVDWLDAARFADSNGYQVDRDREMYAWRDWVIAALNANKPFDQFTIEQIAGDLLPDATLQQKIATGFHRNHSLNEEGGVIPEEFLAEYCADRVETTATVWLGQTFSCARCHDHKFDPFTQRDFYSLYAFFHNVTEKGKGNYGANIRRNAPPILQLPAPKLEAVRKVFNEALAVAKKQLAEQEAKSLAGQAEWESRLRESSVQWSPAKPITARIEKEALKLDEKLAAVRIHPLPSGKHLVVIETGLPLSTVTALHLQFSRPKETLQEAGKPAIPVPFRLEELRVFPATEEKSSDAKPLKIRPVQIENTLPATTVAKALDGSDRTLITFTLKEGAATSLVVELDPPISRETSATLRLEMVLLVKAMTLPWELRVSTTDVDADLLAPADIVKIVRASDKQRTPDEQKKLAQHRAAKDPVHRNLTDRITALTKKVDETDLQIPTTLVMEEMPHPRSTFILIRGAYDKKGAEVTSDTPQSLPAMASGLPKNRLGLARWLVDPANPLPARVTVNRYWQSLFGTGLVRTSGDFGTQGEPPTHPELLDWLATEFVRVNWDVKAMMRLLVTSATYRQSSRLTPALYRADPENRLLARGPRFRLQAEFLRDQALAASGLLVSKIGGPSVRPYHPPGLYEQVVSGKGANTYVLGKGDELYRRSLYTYWKRSVPNPGMLVFDAPFREMCAVRRSRTNTPLQALNLMNDPTYVEAARFLAERMIREGGDGPEGRITHGFRLVLARSPHAAELAILTAAYERAIQEFQADPTGAAELIKVGASTADAKIDATQLAALATVASTILNLDETVTKE